MRKRKPSIYYKTEMVKVKNEILWRAVEMPSKLVLKESFFEEDVKKVPGLDLLRLTLKRLLSFKTKTRHLAYLVFPLSLIRDQIKKDSQIEVSHHIKCQQEDEARDKYMYAKSKWNQC